MAPHIRPASAPAVSSILNHTWLSAHASSGIQTVMVTGGAGFIGSHTAEALLKLGKRVVVVDELNDYYDVKIKEGNVQLLRDVAKAVSDHPEDVFVFYQHDICNRSAMQRVIEEESIDAIIHLAARAGVRASIDQPELYVQSNVLGTTVLLELYHQYKHQIKHFLYASSSSVYGSRPQIPFSDLALLDTAHVQSPYAATKLAGETMAWAYSNMFQLRMTGLRFFTVYGPRGRVDMAPFKFVDRISRGEPIDMYGDGSSMRDYTYISDIVSGILGALFAPHVADTPLHRVYNLGNGTPVHLKRFISIIEQCVGQKAIIRQLPDQTGDVDRTFADISLATKELGYQPRVRLEEGIQQLVNWYRGYKKHET